MSETISTIVAENVMKKGEGLLKALFGSAVSELGESFTDKIRLRRFKNLLEIFAKANDHLQANDLKAKPVALKHLVPLLDLSSLEEDPKIQEKWANVISNLAAFDSLDIFNKNCIELLNKLSPAEIHLMDNLYEKFIQEHGEVVERRGDTMVLKDYREMVSSETLFDPWQLANELSIDHTHIKLYIENLVALGLLQFEEMELEGEELIKSFNVHLSYLGLYFVRLCKFY